jgi:hypothetical protein
MRRNFPGARLETGARHRPHPGGRDHYAVQAITPGCCVANSTEVIADLTAPADTVPGRAVLREEKLVAGQPGR